MAKINVMERGRIEERDSAFPTTVQLPEGRIICAYSVGGGQYATGGTEYSYSDDNGKSWNFGGVILGKDNGKKLSNALRISAGDDSRTLFAYGSQAYTGETERFGEKKNFPVLCRSVDSGKTWEPPVVINNPYGVNVETSYPIFSNRAGKLFAPASLLPEKRLGERVILFVSEDNGASWDRHVTAFSDPEGKHGYFEHKFAVVDRMRLMGVSWTVTLAGVEDRENTFVISADGGETWSAPRSTGIMGQTMTPVHTGGDELLVLYNRRYGEQGIVMLLVRYTEEDWTVLFESMLYEPGIKKQRPENVKNGVDEFKDFAFGYPTAVRLQDGTYLATYWSVENGKCGISCARLDVQN